MGCLKFVSVNLLALSALLPGLALASGGRLPSAARAALVAQIRADLGQGNGAYNGTLRLRRSSLSKGLEGTDRLRRVSAQDGRVYANGAAYIYQAQAIEGVASKKAGSYIVVERANTNDRGTHWEARSLATPLTKALQPSRQLTKSLRRPATGGGSQALEFIASGASELQKNAMVIRAANATVAKGSYDSVTGRTTEVLAQKVDSALKTITLVALGDLVNPGTVKQAVADLVLYGAPVPMFTRPATLQRSLIPRHISGGNRPPSNPDWAPTNVSATVQAPR